MKDSPIITVTGKAAMDFAPDQVIIALTFQHTYATYLEAQKNASKHQQGINSFLQANHLDLSLAKVKLLHIKKDITSIRDKHFNEKERKLLGYQLNLWVHITLDLDKETLPDLIRQLSNTSPEADMRLYYSLKDPQQYELQVLAAAVKNAQAKAETITTVANCTLDGIKDINPNAAESRRNTTFNGGDQFSYFSMEDTSKNCLDEITFDEITFDDITIEQAVTIRWYLK